MKTKRKKSILLAAFIAAIAAIGLSVGCGKNTDNADIGKDDWTVEAMYARAQNYGYSGTLEEFIAQIKGDKGDKGDTGEAGKDGENGENGKDGVGVASFAVNKQGELIVTLTDGTTTNLGNIKGEQGETGEQGIGIKNVAFSQLGELVVSFSDGSNVNCGKIPDCAHTYSEWKEEQAASCTSIGYKTRECSKCGKIEYEFTQAAGHAYGEWQELISDCTSHWQIRICAVCGDSQIAAAEICAENHRWCEWKTTKQATCTENGEETRVCVNDPSHRETRILPAKGHTFQDGKCTDCGKLKTSDDLEFTLNSDNNSYSVSGAGSCTDARIVIPATYNGKPVTAIADEAFYNLDSLVDVIIPDSVTKLGRLAFANCSGLQNVTIPKSVTDIGIDAFEGCSGLENITVNGDNAKYHSKGNCLIETESKTLIIGCKTSVIPADGSVTSIGPRAFSLCSGLTNIIIPDGITSLGDASFYGCDGLTGIIIPDSVKNIGRSAFCGCGKLKNIILPNGLTSIETCTFQDCVSLTDITLPASVKIIDNYAFACCDNLAEIILPDSVTTIGTAAFSFCSSLKNITLGSGVTSIGMDAFSNCDSLYKIINRSNLVLTFGNKDYGGIAENAKVIIDKNGNTLYADDYIPTENEISA